MNNMTEDRERPLPQGKLQLSLDAGLRILTIDATGPFGIDFSEQYHAQILPLRNALKPIAWGSLAILRGGESLMDEKIRTFLVGSIKDARHLGLKVTALVLEPDASDRLIAWWDALYKETGLRFGVFTDKHEAMSFLTINLQKS